MPASLRFTSGYADVDELKRRARDTLDELKRRAWDTQSASRLRMLQLQANAKQLQKELEPVSTSVRSTWKDGQGPTSTRPV